MIFPVTKTIFELALEAIYTGQYPFGKLKMHQKHDFDIFFEKFIIDEKFFLKGNKV